MVSVEALAFVLRTVLARAHIARSTVLGAARLFVHVTFGDAVIAAE
jgi:hypothetical protein